MASRGFGGRLAAGALAAAVAAAFQGGAAFGAEAAVEELAPAAPARLDRLQRRLAVQGEAIAELLKVMKDLDAVAEYEASGILLAEDGDAAELLAAALERAQARKRRPSAVTASTAPPAEDRPPSPAARQEEPALRGPLRLGPGDVLYAQAGDPGSGVPGKVVLRMRGRERAIVAGGAAADAGDEVVLVAVEAADDGTLAIVLAVNGRRAELSYPERP